MYGQATSCIVFILLIRVKFFFINNLPCCDGLEPCGGGVADGAGLQPVVRCRKSYFVIVIVLLIINVPKNELIIPSMKITVEMCFILPPNGFY